jgi:transcriptional regulator GlxA family with amidase domain
VGGCKVIARGSSGVTAVGSGKTASAMRTIVTSASNRLSAARIAKQSKVSHATFYKHFRANTGTTPARELRETRLKKACQMLAETDASITEIATACGFSGGNYFARFFRNATGHTPSDYRQQHRGT